MKISNKKGFTIVELMIASSIFSLMLLVVLGAVLYLGRLYYKGITVSNTLQTTRSVVDLATESVQYSGEQYRSLPAGSGWDGAYCTGGKKFSYRLGTQLVGSSPGSGQATQVLVLSDDPVCNTVVPPGAVSDRELLKENMRILSFDMTPVSGDLTNISFGVAFGGDPSDPTVDTDTFDYTAGQISGCKDSTRGSAFCAISYLTTSQKSYVTVLNAVQGTVKLS